MVRADKNALICDLAETYGIYDWRALPLHTVATLAAGLREDSRIVMKMSGHRASLTDLLLASIFDKTALLVWSKTKDAEKNRNRPSSMFALLSGQNRDKEYKVYDSGEDFERDRQRILEKIKRTQDGNRVS